MEMKEPIETPNSPLTNQEPDVETVPDTQLQYRQSVLYKYRRNFIILTICILLIFLLLFIITISIIKSSCNNADKNSLNGLHSKKVLIDTKNRSCFYKRIRLPDDIVPHNYHIYLHPNISENLVRTRTAYFNGNITIDCVCKKATNIVLLSAKEMKVTDPVITLNGRKSSVLETSFCPALEQYYIEFSDSCTPGDPVRIVVTFHAILKKQLVGFYLSDYKTKAGQLKTLITTHFEPTSARLAFPCFDEPMYKANFSLEMVRDEKHHTLFNMPLKSTRKLPNGLVIDSYYSTVKMSTYIVAYMLLPEDYVYKEGMDGNNRTRIRIFAPRDQETYTRHALNVTNKVLPYFENFFGLKYPLPKLDMIAIPDFAAGAMENWGLITYRMSTLLVNPKSNKTQHRASIAKIISHEIAHQWFGNIVTMKWWNDLWLNEGFASYGEYMGGNHFNPDWRMYDQFYLEQIKGAMSFDSLINSHPIQVPVKDPEEIEAIFDQISYGKGASLVRMLESILEMNVLKRGLSIYLNKYRYRNAISDSLWECFSEAYKEVNKDTKLQSSNPIFNLKRVMATWLNQMNFPLVTHKRTGKKSFRLTQSRFLLYPNATKLWKEEYKSPYDYMWCIPILFMTDKMKQKELIWLDLEKSKEFSIDHEYKWIKLNYGQTGFYRVLYEDIDNWNQLINVMKTNRDKLPQVDRAGLLNDAFLLARGGQLDLKIGLDMSGYIKKETWNVPWRILTEAFYEIRSQLSQDIELYKKFQMYGESLVKEVMAKTNFGKIPEQKTSKPTIYQFGVIFQNEKALKLALRNYRIYKNNGTIVDPNFHSMALYSAIVSENGGKEWDYLYDKFLNSHNSDTKRTLKSVLAKTKDSTRLNKLLMKVKNSFKLQTVVSVLLEASQGSSEGLDQAWLFLRRHWDYFTKSKDITKQYFLIADLLKICSGLMTEYDYKQAEQFFTSTQLGTGGRSAKQSLEMIKSNILWNDKNIPSLRKFLNSKYP